jgi:hypothetical protein
LERNTLSIDIFSRDTFLQKLNYIHRNPVHERWGLSALPEDYQYSSALFYETGVDNPSISSGGFSNSLC